MSTKVEQVLNPYSAWNAAPNAEPVFVLRADDWRFMLLFAALSADKGGRLTPTELMKHAVEMKKYSDENDIPF